MYSPAHRSLSVPARRPFSASSARYRTADIGSDMPLVMGAAAGQVWAAGDRPKAASRTAEHTNKRRVGVTVTNLLHPETLPLFRDISVTMGSNPASGGAVKPAMPSRRAFLTAGSRAALALPFVPWTLRESQDPPAPADA